MCCLFTCCGWMIDLVQRLWTFTMSCCISSAVCCVMLTSSMSGIALGYNYSLAEYIDLKETNVSIYLKRGVFDDEIADDMDWRRSGRMPVAGHIGENNLRTGASEDESTTLRSGRRLDDSVFEADDQNKYEGSLMKLTAKPVFLNTPRPKVTDDLEMGDVITKYPMNSLDQMKAIQGVIDSRRAMATGGTTFSPLATYNDRNLQHLPMYANPPENMDLRNSRRFMGHVSDMKAPVNPARMAVPDRSIGSGSNWLVPKRPSLYNKNAMPDYYIPSLTYPSPITLKPTLMTPSTPSTDELPEYAVMFATRTVLTRKTKKTTTKLDIIQKVEKDSEAFNEQFLLEGDVPSKNEVMKIPKIIKSSEEEYEDEIKGLPVRKRRNIKADTLFNNYNTRGRNNTHLHEHKFTSVYMYHSDFNKTTKVNEKSDSSFITYSKSSNHTMNSSNENNSNTNKYNNPQTNIQTSSESNEKQQMKLNENYKSDTIKTETINDESTDNFSKVKPRGTFLDHIVTAIATKKSTLTAVTHKTELVSGKNIKIVTRNKSFESKIVSSKYGTSNRVTRLFDTKGRPLSNAEILNSISVNLNEAGLLKNPASSTFVKLLQSTLT